MFKAIVFDLDGTLVDSPLCFKTIRQKLGIPENETILEFLDTLPFSERAAKYKSLEEIELAAAKGAVLIPGVKELLAEIKNAKIKLGLLTRNCRSATTHILQKHQLAIDLVISRDDAKAKPHPEGLFKIMKTWELKANELLYVGDFRFDIECGKRAGVKTALYGTNPQLLLTPNPDFLISDYCQFWDVVKSD